MLETGASGMFDDDGKYISMSPLNYSAPEG